MPWSIDGVGANSDGHGSSKNPLLHRALAEKQAMMVVAAAEAQKRIMETSTNGATTKGCCSKCWKEVKNAATQFIAVKNAYKSFRMQNHSVLL